MATHSIGLADPDLQRSPSRYRRRGDGPRLVIAALAAAVLVAAVLVLGLDGLIPFGLLLVFSADPDDSGRRSVILTRRNLGVAAVMALAFAWFWLWHVDLTESMQVLIGGALIALPLALQDPAGHAATDAPSRSPNAASSWPSGGWWSSSTSTTPTDRAGTCWRRCASSCRSSWRRPGHGAPAAGGSSSGCSATRSAEGCDPTWCRPSTSGCAARFSVEWWPPEARITRGSGYR